jgi:hypothetical protein
MLSSVIRSGNRPPKSVTLAAMDLWRQPNVRPIMG